ncbi:Ribonuclease P protein component [Flavobacterium longum]|uniref:ribonuclease P protein component n=1 Tax=Flavobacterium longum TaxID=1299340 RepID=UPI0039ED1ED2
MDAKYPKHEKLKSRKTIDALFAKGKSVSKFPLRLVYLEHAEIETGLIQLGVSVSKKHFKRAHDRNYFKRVLRETYRLNKASLFQNLDKPYAMMLLYQTKDRLSFQDINAKTIALFEKFGEAMRAEKTSV